MNVIDSASAALDGGLVVVDQVAHHIPIAEIAVVLETLTKVAKLVKEVIQTERGNNADCKRILAAVRDLELIHCELIHVFQKDTFPKSCSLGFKRLSDSLRTCTETCEQYNEKMLVQKFVKASYYQRTLHTIESELDSTIRYLQLALQLGMMYKQKEQTKAQYDVMRRILNTREGIFLNPYEDSEIPFQPEHPFAATLNETKMIISWIDTKNEKHSVLRYEVMLDSGVEQLFPFSVTELTPKTVMVRRLETKSGQFHYEEASDSINKDSTQSESTGLKYSVCFCPPILSEGQLYEVKVRAVNGRGPSEWSDECLFRYNSGHPKQPQIISLDTTKLLEIEIEVKVYEQEHPINEILVAYANINDPTQTRWDIRHISEDFKRTSKNHVEKSFMVTFKTENLHPSNYRFKVAAKNSLGCSPWSSSDDISQDAFPPSAPSNLVLSRNDDAENSMVLKWEKPLVNPLGVHEYKIHYRKEGKHKKWIHSVHSKKGEIYIATNLKTEQNYLFQVESVNRMGKGCMSEAVSGRLIKKDSRLTKQASKRTSSSGSSDVVLGEESFNQDSEDESDSDDNDSENLETLEDEDLHSVIRKYFVF